MPGESSSPSSNQRAGGKVVSLDHEAVVRSRWITSQWGRRAEQRRSEITTVHRLIDVQILDHLVIIAGETVSMAARGLL